VKRRQTVAEVATELSVLIGKVKQMSAQLDSLAHKVGDLEVAAQAVLVALKSPSPDGPAIDGLSVRVQAVTDALKSAVPPAV
jgi:molybdopterin synthase catalytic subunit